MPTHQYTPDQALEILMRRLSARDQGLGSQVQAAIDAGKDVWESEPGLGRRRKDHWYRKTVPFSSHEALQIALDALQAYFVEQPLFVDSSADNFAKTAIGVPTQGRPYYQNDGEDREPVSLEGVGREKVVEIEMQTETQLSRAGEETIRLERMPRDLIEMQRHHIADLRKLTDFSEE